LQDRLGRLSDFKSWRLLPTTNQPDSDWAEIKDGRLFKLRNQLRKTKTAPGFSPDAVVFKSQ
jgi:hypothetical protein